MEGKKKCDVTTTTMVGKEVNSDFPGKFQLKRGATYAQQQKNRETTRTNTAKREQTGWKSDWREENYFHGSSSLDERTKPAETVLLCKQFSFPRCNLKPDY